MGIVGHHPCDEPRLVGDNDVLEGLAVQVYPRCLEGEYAECLSDFVDGVRDAFQALCIPGFCIRGALCILGGHDCSVGEGGYEMFL